MMLLSTTMMLFLEEDLLGNEVYAEGYGCYP